MSNLSRKNKRKRKSEVTDFSFGDVLYLLLGLLIVYAIVYLFVKY